MPHMNHGPPGPASLSHTCSDVSVTARVSVRSADSREQLAVPLSAITDLGERKAVFVRHEHDDYEVHDVQLGQTAGGFVGVLSGLKEGEEVVVSGVHTLRSVVLKGSMKDGD